MIKKKACEHERDFEHPMVETYIREVYSNSFDKKTGTNIKKNNSNPAYHMVSYTCKKCGECYSIKQNR